MKRWMMAAALVAVPTSAQAMTVHEFLSKVAALKSRGILAIGSPDIGLLKDEIAGIQRDWKTDSDAAKRAGRPLACPAPGAKPMAQEDFIKALESIPPARRGMSMKAAFYGIAKKRHPCPRR